MTPGTELLQALPVAVYTTDTEGRITFFNEAAAELWGHRPELGSDRWCGSWRLYWPDGRPLPHDQCPMALCLREGRPVRGMEAVAERPDGSRVSFMPYPSPLKDASGQVVGAVNVLVDVTDRRPAEIEAAKLAAIVSSSDDAIISKTLTGHITSWNAGATRIFGYEADEMIGQSILRIIPPELHGEEAGILAKLQRGERIEHFDTERVTKDGRRIALSLTVSPLRDRTGTVVGASKVARDVTERKKAEALQRLLFDELNHRVKNTLATIQAIANQSLHRAASPDDFTESFNGRVEALARAHDLLVQGRLEGADVLEIVREQVILGATDGSRITYAGPPLMLEARIAVQLALVLHELSTNARKYGGLSVPDGRLAITWRLVTQGERALILDWRESGLRDLRPPAAHGFGTTLIERTLQANGGEAMLRYEPGGLVCELRLPVSEERRWDAQGFDRIADAQPERRSAVPDLRGVQVLVIEDEPIIAMDLARQLASFGCQVVGPASSLPMAMRLVESAACDLALVDANLGGRPADSIAAALTRKGVPFAFATGYGREGLPADYRHVGVLAKPFRPAQLRAMIESLLAR